MTKTKLFKEIDYFHGDSRFSVKEIEKIADFFKAFSDPTRLKILYTLSEAGSLDVGGIALKIGVTESAVSHQLKTLKQQRLVDSQREGKYVFYTLDDGHIDSVLNAAYEHISE